MPKRTIYRARQAPPIPVPSSTYDPYQMAWLMGQLPDSPPLRLPVSEKTLLGLPAAHAAVSKIANAVAQMMCAADVFGADGRTPVGVPSIVIEPNPGYDAFTFWKEVASTALMRGNYVALKTAPDRQGYPTMVQPIPIGAAHAYVDEAGYVVYEINGDHYEPDDVVHIRIGVTFPGDPWCVGVVEAFRRGLGGMLAQQGMANSVFENGAVPSVHLQVDVPNLGADQAALTRRNWEGAHAGRRGTGVTGKNVSVTPLSWSADDAQFLETQQFSVAQAALMFGLRPEDLGATVGGSSLTYGNRTDDAIQRITDAYVPVMMPIEQAWSRLIPGRNFVRGNAEALLRSTTKERYEVHALAQQIGVETVDETRDIEGKPKLDPEPEPPAVEPVSADATTDDQEEGGDAA